MALRKKRFQLTDVHIKAIKAEDSDEPQDFIAEISGFATTYEKPGDYDSYGEIVDPNAIDLKAPGHKDLPMLNSHGGPIGIWVGYETKKDSRGVGGLWVTGKIANTPEGTTVATLIRVKAIKGLSIGFEILRDEGGKRGYLELEDHETEWGYPVVKLTKIGLREISPTSFPANTHAQLLEVRAERLEKWTRRRKVKLSPEKPKMIVKSRKKEFEFSIALMDSIGALVEFLAEGDDPLTQEDLIVQLTEALEFTEEEMQAVLDGKLMLSTVGQIETVAEVLGVEASTLFNAAAKNMQPILDMASEEVEDEDEEVEEDTTDEDEALEELSLQLSTLASEIKALR